MELGKLGYNVDIATGKSIDLPTIEEAWEILIDLHGQGWTIELASDYGDRGWACYVSRDGEEYHPFASGNDPRLALRKVAKKAGVLI